VLVHAHTHKNRSRKIDVKKVFLFLLSKHENEFFCLTIYYQKNSTFAKTNNQKNIMTAAVGE
jgi:hypothetical protein